MALPDFANGSDIQIDVADVAAGTLTANLDATFFHGGSGVRTHVISAAFLASGGVAAMEVAVIDALVAKFAALGFGVLNRTSCFFPTKKQGS